MTTISQKTHAGSNGGYKDVLTQTRGAVVTQQQQAGQMWLTVQGREDTKRTVEIRGDRFVIGRRPDCDLVLTDRQISGRHAALERRDGRVFLRDLQSTNGTAVNGLRISGIVELMGGEEIRVGETTLVYGVARPRGPRSPRSPRPPHQRHRRRRRSPSPSSASAPARR